MPSLMHENEKEGEIGEENMSRHEFDFHTTCEWMCM